MIWPGTESNRRHADFQIVAGERRFRAAQLAGKEFVPAISRELSDRDALEIQVIENDQREDVPAIEQAEGYHRLIDQHGYTVETLATKISRSPAYVYGRLVLARLPKIARDMLAKGTLSQSVAQLIARIPNPALREAAAKEVCDIAPWDHEPMSYREAKAYIESEFMVELKGAPFSKKDPNLYPEAGSCVTCPKMSGNNRQEYPGGRADICNDPPCYKKKVELHSAALLKAAGEKGYKVLSKKESEILFRSGGTVLRYDSIYIDLAAQCDEDQKRRSYKQLIGDQVQPLVAQDPQGNIHYIVPKSEAAKALKVAGIKSPSVSSGSSSSSDRAAQLKRREDEKRKLEAHRQAATQAMAHVAIETERKAPESFPMIRTLTLAAYSTFANWGNLNELTLNRRGVEIKEKKHAYYTERDYAGAMHGLIEKMNDKEVFGLHAEIIAGRVLDMWSRSSESKLDDKAIEFLKGYKFDILALANQVESQLKAQAEEKKPRANKEAKVKSAQAV